MLNGDSVMDAQKSGNRSNSVRYFLYGINSGVVRHPTERIMSRAKKEPTIDAQAAP